MRVGFSLYHSPYCNVTNSYAESNYESGIVVRESGNVNITRNYLKSNHCYGIKLERTSLGVYVAFNTILDTHFNTRVQPTSPGTGIYTNYANSATMEWNTITNCDSYGIMLDFSTDCNASKNSIGNCYRGCTFEWQGSGNIISDNTCVLAGPWFFYVLVVPISIGVVIAAMSIILVRRCSQKRQRKEAWIEIGPKKSLLIAAGWLIGVIAFTLFTPISSMDYIERDVGYYQINFIWGTLSNMDEQHQLGLLPGVGLPFFGVGWALLLSCTAYLLVKRVRLSKDHHTATAAKALTIPLWSVAVAIGFCLTATGYYLNQLGVPDMLNILGFELQSMMFAFSIAGILFAWRARAGPWLVPPSTWEEVGKQNDYYRDAVYQVKNLHDAARDGEVSIDALVASQGRRIGAIRREIKDLVLRRFIDGKFTKHGEFFVLHKVNLGFIVADAPQHN